MKRCEPNLEGLLRVAASSSRISSGTNAPVLTTAHKSGLSSRSSLGLCSMDGTRHVQRLADPHPEIDAHLSDRTPHNPWFDSAAVNDALKRMPRPVFATST